MLRITNSKCSVSNVLRHECNCVDFTVHFLKKCISFSSEAGRCFHSLVVNVQRQQFREWSPMTDPCTPSSRLQTVAAEIRADCSNKQKQKLICLLVVSFPRPMKNQFPNHVWWDNYMSKSVHGLRKLPPTVL